MNKWILGVSLILFLLTSCSKDNDEGTPQSDDIMNGGAELKFSSDVLSSIVVDVDPTRSSTRAPLSSFENNSQIGIYGIPGVDGGRNESCNLRDCKFESDFQKYLFNGRYTYVSGYDELQSEFQATYPSRANPALYLYGYYPYTDKAEYREIAGASQWAVPWQLDTDNMANTIDYLYTGEKFVRYSEWGLNPITLEFQHAFGRVDFKFYTTSMAVLNKNYTVESVTITCISGKKGWMAIANGSMSFTTEQFTSTYKVVDGSVAWNIPGEPAARFMFPHTQTLIKEVTCVMRSGAGEVKKYTIYDQYSGYTIPVRQGEITNMNVKFLPKDASISSAVDVNSWDSNTTIDKDVKL
ncbi:Fimbrillin-like protein [Bacteroides finegoldii]|jgi:hypothetical protein|uniref:Fimbrillin-like protein n=2 Tax=Bacteroides TaxID=816 RepID=K5CM18_9BACE|nr:MULTISPECIES: fimbrillin family protein [Bacteroides]EKJ90370.1 hypothetical protein HMPREF1057_02405 [Bacteroides finegoldii CL09T03C10]MDC7138632.1 fimbrillin family protein [Bacteroides zhangwenhongii]OKZ24646.1 MAG: hypothetical protein BHV74_03740 [Bacteroides finegoldii]SCH71992.1 Uncharacterised protein [uncultured Bacteroides sp.]